MFCLSNIYIYNCIYIIVYIYIYITIYIYVYDIALLDFHRVYLVEMESGYRLRCLAALRPYATSIPCAVWPVRSSVHGAVDLGSQLFPLKSPFNMFKLLNYVSIWVPFGSWVLGFRFIQVVSRCLILVTPGVFCDMQNHFNHLDTHGSEDSPEPAPKPSASSRARFCWVMGKGGVKHVCFLDVRTHMHRLNGTNVLACFSSGKT